MSEVSDVFMILCVIVCDGRSVINFSDLVVVVLLCYDVSVFGGLCL